MHLALLICGLLLRIASRPRKKSFHFFWILLEKRFCCVDIFSIAILFFSRFIPFFPFVNPTVSSYTSNFVVKHLGNSPRNQHDSRFVMFSCFFRMSFFFPYICGNDSLSRLCVMFAESHTFLPLYCDYPHALFVAKLRVFFIRIWNCYSFFFCFAYSCMNDFSGSIHSRIYDISVVCLVL